MKLFNKALLGAILFFLSTGIFAQQNQEYRITEEGKITQTLSWTRTNAYFYEIEIEQETGGLGKWKTVLKQRTEDVTIDVALQPGMYRYRILTYNMLSKVANTSDWTGLRVYPAVAPVIESFTPSSFAVDSLQESFTITFTGKDLSLEAKVILKMQTKDDRPVPEIEPLSVEGTAAGETLIVTFPSKGLITGPYTITLRNPGGLSSEVEFNVGFKRNIDITIAAGYAPLAPVSGTTLKDGYDTAFCLIGAYTRLTVIPFKRTWGSLGAELTPQYTMLKTSIQGGDLKGNLITMNLNAVYQKWFVDYTVALNFKLGGGIAILNQKAPYDDAANSLFYSVNAGVGVQWYLWKELFVDFSLGYNHLIDSKDSESNGFLPIFVGAGWRL